MNSLSKDDVKKAVHEALDERVHPCVFANKEQSALHDGAKVINIFKGFVSYGLALGLGATLLLGLIGWFFYKPIMAFLAS